MKAELSLVAKGSRIAGATVTRCAPAAVIAVLLAGTPAHAAGRRGAVHARQGNVRAELTYELIADGSDWQHGRLQIWSGKQRLVNRSIPYGEKAYGMRPLAIRQLDGAGAPEVLFTEFSGGSCGCVTTWIYAGARRLRAPWAINPTIRDADGDGKPEFHGVWGLGLSYSSRADYRFPVRIWSYVKGALHDVTRAFPAEVQADQADQYAAFQSQLANHDVGGARNAMAAYVADGYTLGEGDAAMAVLQAAVDAGQLDDPDGAVSTSEYVSQVQAALREQGYATDAPLAGAARAQAGHHHVIHAQLGELRAELSYDQVTPNYWQHSRLRIWSGKRLLVNRPVSVFAPLYGSRPIAVRQLDGVGPPEVLLTEFSGGNGCCFTNWIYAGAKRIRAPWLDPPVIRDADGDGKPEFHGLEPKWWTWGSRGDDRNPVKVWSYAGGAVHNVTRSFPAEALADQAAQYAFFQSSLQSGDVGGARNGMSAYVADGYTLGQGDAAMAVLQAAVDAGQLDDPGGEGSTSEYVERLNQLLRDDGYTT